MGIFKANVFCPDGTPAIQDHQLATETSTGFLKKMMENAGVSKGRANALRTHAQVAAISALSGESPSEAADLVASIALSAASEMGYSIDEDSTELSRAMPVLARASSEAVLAHLQATLIQTGKLGAAIEETRGSAKSIARSLAAFSKNPVLAKHVSSYQDFDNDARTAISLSSIEAMAKLLSEINRFDFWVGQKKAMQFCAKAISSGFLENLSRVAEGDPSEAKPGHRVMLINSFYKTVSEVFIACWQDEVRRTRVGIKKARQSGVNEDALDTAVKKRITLVEQSFLDRLDLVLSCGLDENPVSKIVKQQIVGNKP